MFLYSKIHLFSYVYNPNSVKNVAIRQYFQNLEQKPNRKIPATHKGRHPVRRVPAFKAPDESGCYRCRSRAHAGIARAARRLVPPAQTPARATRSLTARRLPRALAPPTDPRRCRRHSQAHTANAIARADARALALPAPSTSGNCPQSVSACAALPARTTRVHTAGARAASVPARRQRSRRLMPRASCAPGRAPRRCPTRPCRRLAPWTACHRRRP